MFKGKLFCVKGICIALVFLSCFSFKSQAQESDSAFEEVWFQYYNKSVFSDKWSLSTDMGYRLKEASFVDVSQFFIRSGVGYQINPSVRFLLGVAMFNTHASGDREAVEYRPHQQLSTKHTFGKIGFGNRIRVEERFIKIKGTDDAAAIETFNFRFRYRFLFDFPLFSLSKKENTNRISLMFGDEIIVSTGKNEFLDFAAQNRFLIGPAIKFNKKNALFVLYNFTSVTKDIPAIVDEYGILWIGYKQTFDFKK